jgi:hypothetical protein
VVDTRRFAEVRANVKRDIDGVGIGTNNIRPAFLMGLLGAGNLAGCIYLWERLFQRLNCLVTDTFRVTIVPAER